MDCKGDPQGHVPRTEPTAAMSVWRAVALALMLALVFAVAEVVMRFGVSGEPIVTSQWALALYTNVALLGLASLAVVVGGQLLFAVAMIMLPIGQTHRPFACILLRHGTVVACLVLLTEGVALATDSTAKCFILAGLAGLLACLCTWAQRWLGVPGLSRYLAGMVVVVWAWCTLGTVGAVQRTADRISAWTTVDAGSPSASHPVRPNIILLVLDTLRADRVGVLGGGRLTPNIDRLAESSAVYTNAISTAPWTLPTHASLFTGLYPDRHGVSWGNYQLDEQPPVLAELLKEQGYDTFAISNNFLLSKENGYARGFDVYVETVSDPLVANWQLAARCGAPKTVLSRLGISEDALTDAGSALTNWLMRKRLANQVRLNRPFFAFVNYYEPHDPYDPPRRFVDRFLTSEEREACRDLHQTPQKLAAHALGIPDVLSSEQISLLTSLYDAEVAYQDEVVGELFSFLQSMQLLDDSWLVVLSDHGELFGEWGMVYHTASAHYQLLHIPLVVRPPGGVAETHIDAPVQPVDVFVSLLKAAGAILPPGVQRAYPLPLSNDVFSPRKLCISQTHAASIIGLSIAQKTSFQTDFTRWLTWLTTVVEGDRLLELDQGEPRGLYDVSEDPNMNENLLASLPDTAESIRARFEAWQDERNKGEVTWLSGKDAAYSD